MGVKSGFVQGMTTRQIVKNVVGVGGLADISERNAATVIRTALAHVSTKHGNRFTRRTTISSRNTNGYPHSTLVLLPFAGPEILCSTK